MLSSLSRMLVYERNLDYGGEGGIRTHGWVSPTHAFQACSLNRSDTSPGLTLWQLGEYSQAWRWYVVIDAAADSVVQPRRTSRILKRRASLRFERYGLADLTGESGAGLANLAASIAALGCT